MTIESAARSRETQTKLVVIGPLPPPIHGVAVSTSLVLANPRLRRRFSVVHVDTSDPRSGANINTWDVQNVWVGVRGLGRLMRALAGERGVVYLPLSQGAPGFLRDSIFVHWAALRGWTVAGHLRGGEFHHFYAQRGPLYRWWTRLTLARTDSVGVPSASLRLMFDGLVPPDRIDVVPNGTPDLYDDSHHRDPSCVLFLSNLKARKGLLEAIAAALLVIEEHSSAHFVFAGSWYADKQLEREVREQVAPAGDRIRFQPPVSGKAKTDLLLSAAILLFPPVEPEGHSRVVLEALAAGMPVVTTDQGAIAETVIDGECGFVLHEPVPRQLADRVLELLEDPQLRDRMGRAARSRYLAKYTEERADHLFSEWLEGLVGYTDQ